VAIKKKGFYRYMSLFLDCLKVVGIGVYNILNY